MRKHSLLIVIVLSIILLMGCDKAQVQISPDEQKEPVKEAVQESIKEEKIVFDQMDNVFAFADESGKRLISFQGPEDKLLSNPESFNLAIGNNGEIHRIRFVERQDANSKDTLRQSIYNFDNMAGYIYEAIEGELIQNKTYILAGDARINKNAFIKLTSTRDMESATDYYKKVDSETIKVVEEIKGRKVVKSSLLSESIEHEKVCLFVFERQADDMLASIAYIKENRVVFKDYPAKYDEMSTWRVDAGDEPGLFEVLFLANSDQGLLLGLTWGAPEGENIYVLKELKGKFEETDISAGRYWSP